MYKIFCLFKQFLRNLTISLHMNSFQNHQSLQHLGFFQNHQSFLQNYLSFLQNYLNFLQNYLSLHYLQANHFALHKICHTLTKLLVLYKSLCLIKAFMDKVSSHHSLTILDLFFLHCPIGTSSSNLRSFMDPYKNFQSLEQHN